MVGEIIPESRATSVGISILGQLPAILALNRSKQALQIAPHPPARLNPAKARRDPLDQLIQPARPISSLVHHGYDHLLHDRSDYHLNPGCSTRPGIIVNR